MHREKQRTDVIELAVSTSGIQGENSIVEAESVETRSNRLKNIPRHVSFQSHTQGFNYPNPNRKRDATQEILDRMQVRRASTASRFSPSLKTAVKLKDIISV